MAEINKINLSQLGYYIKIQRDTQGMSQQELADKIGSKVNRSKIAHLEQGIRFPNTEIVKLICETINLPKPIWEPLLSDKVIQRLNFEIELRELIGFNISFNDLDDSIIKVVEEKIANLFNKSLTSEQTIDFLNSILVFYGVKLITKPFFDRYLKNDSFKNAYNFNQVKEIYQKDAIRLFSTLKEAYIKLNIQDTEKFNDVLLPLKENDLKIYQQRIEWDRITEIPDKDLPYLGYIAASKVKKEQDERKELSDYLNDIAEGRKDINDASTKQKRKIESLLRKFKSNLDQGLFSSLFLPDKEILIKEASYISPAGDSDYNKMARIQKIAYDNLSNYLTADYMDIYVATSMRNDADFISVNDFIVNLFNHQDLKELKLRYFNPTQSWIDDRVAKGLVEALMLKRANICIYMAQKEDTFGKDSEASVTLGQGKPVVVFVPRLFDKVQEIDSEKFGLMDKKQLTNLIRLEGGEDDVDEKEDEVALHSILLELKLNKIDNKSFERIIKNHWADFDIENEFIKILETEEDKSNVKTWLNLIINDNVNFDLESKLLQVLKKKLIEITIKFESRSRVFREIHPLALQVIHSTGVLNGILVVRSVNSCAKLVRSLLENKLELELISDEHNYKLIEKNTKSTVRVISKHKLISNAFDTYYTK